MTHTRLSVSGVLACILLGAGLCAELLLAQQAPARANSGTLSVRVVDGVTGAPVGAAAVTLVLLTEDLTPRVPRREMTDAAGVFVFSGLPDGVFQVTAAAPGWRTGAYGIDHSVDVGIGRSAGDVMRMTAGAKVGVTVPVWRAAVVSGRVMDEGDAPLAGVSVSAWRWRVVAGRRHLARFTVARTDSSGEFALSVPRGEFLIEARALQTGATPAAAAGGRLAFERTFFPGTPAASQAMVLAVDYGDERSRIDIRMPLRATVRVSGVASRTNGSAWMPRVVQLVQDDDAPLQYAAGLDAQGRFVFDTVAAGRYVLRTPPRQTPIRGPSDQSDVSAHAFVEVADRALEVDLDLRRELIVRGRAVFEGESPRPPLATVTLFRDIDTGNSDVIPAFVPVGIDGQFTFAAPPGRYIITAVAHGAADIMTRPSQEAQQLARRWSLRSAMHAGRDVADTALVLTSDVSDLVLTFTDRRPVLRGSVTAPEVRMGTTSVLVFPSDESLWLDFGVARRLPVARPAADGTFEIATLPAGDYWIVAVRDTGAGELRHPGLLRELVGPARRVTLREGETHMENLAVVAVPVIGAALAPPADPLPQTDRPVIRELP